MTFENAFFFPFDNFSFGLVGKRYSQILCNYYRVNKFNLNYAPLYLSTKRIKRAIFYPFFALPLGYGSFQKEFKLESRVALEVADTDRIAKDKIELLNLSELLITFSQWSRKAYERSGFKNEIKVIPHGIPDEWIDGYPSKMTNFELEFLKKQPAIKILHFNTLGCIRKGTDIACKLVRAIQEAYPNVLFVFKSPFIDPNLRGINVFRFSRWYSEQELYELFKLCDIYLLTSRGGGFELNGLEALACGEVVFYTKGLSPDDYALTHGVPIEPEGTTRFWLDNPVHIGHGLEMNFEKALDKLKEVIENLDEYKAKAKEFNPEPYRWSRISHEFADLFVKKWNLD